MYRLAEFVLDPEDQLLLRGGERVELARKPYTILLFLIENRDRMVTRQELLDRFWDGKDVYDQTLTRAIARIRCALGDSREDPRFIETRWATGYRYIGAFEEMGRIPAQSEPQPVEMASEDGVRASSDAQPEVPVVSLAVVPRAASRAGIGHHLALPLAVALSVAAATVWFVRHPGRSMQNKAASAGSMQAHSRKSIAVFTFKNLDGSAGSEWLGTAFAEMLSTDLAGDMQIRALPGDDVERASRELGINRTLGLSAPVLQTVNRDLDADFVVTGSYLVLGSGRESSRESLQIRVDVEEQNAKSGETIATFSESGRLDTLFDIASSAHSRLRASMHLPSDVVSEDVSSRLRSADPEAFREYMDGLRNLRAENFTAAQKHLEVAIARDAAFPLAHLALADLWSTLGYQQKERTELKTSASMADRLGREQSLAIHARYSASCGDWKGAIQNYQALFTFFPDNLDYGIQLSHAQVAAGRVKDAEITLASLRRLPGSIHDDARIDLAEAAAAQAVSDSDGTIQATQHAMDKAKASGAMLLYAHALSMQAGALARTDIAAAIRKSEESGRICSQFNDLECASNILRRIGIFKVDSDPAGATKALNEALALARKIGNRTEEDNDLNGIAAILANQSDFASADVLYRELLRHAREDHSGWGEQMAMNNLGNDLLAEGRVAESRAMQEGALAISQHIGLKEAASLELMSLSQIDLVEGKLRGAEEHAEQARDAFRKLNSAFEQALAESLLGDVQREENHLAGARKLETGATDFLTKAGDGGSLNEARLALALLTLDSGDSGEASQLAAQAAAGLNRQSRFPREGCAHALLGLALTEKRQYNEAHLEIKRGLALALGKQDRLSSLQVQINAALLEARTPGRMPAADLEATSARMSRLSADAERDGMELPAMRAKLAHAELETRCGRLQEGQQSASQTEHIARQYGYLLLAEQSSRLIKRISAINSNTPAAEYSEVTR